MNANNQEPPLPSVLNPFWWIPSSDGLDASAELVYKTEEVEVPMALSAGKNSCLTKAGGRLPLKIKFPVMTNEVDVAKGTRLTINGGFDDWVVR
jgi:hypothetical protein